MHLARCGAVCANALASLRPLNMFWGAPFFCSHAFTPPGCVLARGCLRPTPLRMGALPRCPLAIAFIAFGLVCHAFFFGFFFSRL